MKKKKPQTRSLKLFNFYRYKKKEGGKTKKARHPKLIVGRSGDTYSHMGLTSSKRKGHHGNMEIVNPENWSQKSWLRKEVRKNHVSEFGEHLPNYKLHPDDKKKVLDFLAKKK